LSAVGGASVGFRFVMHSKDRALKKAR
jgi:hypothetical protein